MTQNDNKGRGWRGDRKAHARVGRLGGLATARTYGDTFYSEIGRLGGKKSAGNFKNNPERAKLLGSKGGQSRRKK